MSVLTLKQEEGLEKSYILFEDSCKKVAFVKTDEYNEFVSCSILFLYAPESEIDPNLEMFILYIDFCIEEVIRLKKTDSSRFLDLELDSCDKRINKYLVSKYNSIECKKIPPSKLDPTFESRYPEYYDIHDEKIYHVIPIYKYIYNSLTSTSHSIQIKIYYGNGEEYRSNPDYISPDSEIYCIVECSDLRICRSQDIVIILLDKPIFLESSLSIGDTFFDVVVDGKEWLGDSMSLDDKGKRQVYFNKRLNKVWQQKTYFDTCVSGSLIFGFQTHKSRLTSYHHKYHGIDVSLSNFLVDALDISSNWSSFKEIESDADMFTNERIIWKSDFSKQVDGFLYMIRPREFIRLKEQTFKIGKASDFMKRFCSYPKGSEVICCHPILVGSKDIAERELINAFKEAFVLKKEYGLEYFNGNVCEMIKKFFEVCARFH
jgi:hypothetical protein